MIKKPNYVQLATVILDYKDIFQVRYCRLCLRPNINTFWFQPPALMGYQNAKCFVINKKENWKYLENMVYKQFLAECEEWVKTGLITKDFVQLIRESNNTDNFEFTNKDFQAIEDMDKKD